MRLENKKIGKNPAECLKWSSLENELREGRVEISMIKYDNMIKCSKLANMFNKKKIYSSSPILFFLTTPQSNRDSRLFRTKHQSVVEFGL